MPAHSITEHTARAACAELGLAFDQKIGEGAFKQVFKVRDGNGELKALKLTDPSAYSARSDREVQVLAECTHPSIAKFYGSGTLTGSAVNALHFSLEEYLAGGTLTDRIKTGLLSAAEAKTLGHGLVGALAHLSSIHRKCVHRDIKPDNIMFRRIGLEPVLVDFGLARVLADVSLTQSWLAIGPGTPYFASPEQLNNQKALIDWRSDQFSLGVTLSVASLGFHPFQEATEPYGAGVIVQRVARREQQTKRFIDACGAAGLGVLVQMTQPWPTHRFRFHQDLLASL